MTPYYEDDHVTIYHGDCFDILHDLSGIGAVVTDPPYSSGGAFRVGKDLAVAGHDAPVELAVGTGVDLELLVVSYLSKGPTTAACEIRNSCLGSGSPAAVALQRSFLVWASMWLDAARRGWPWWPMAVRVLAGSR